MKKRVFLIVIDGLGIGEAVDNVDPSDKGANTLLHILQSTRVYLPTLTKLGLLSFPTITLKPPTTISSYAILNEQSKGKDSTVGHWELAGHITKRAFDTFPDGFPADIVEVVARAFGVDQVLCNAPYSGTDAIKHFGDRHINTRYPILYTSADSCLQIACHSTVYTIEELYYACEYIRANLPKGHNIGRIIARPFAGIKGDYYRTEKRKDFSLPPPNIVLPCVLTAKNISVTAVGKIKDLFAGKGISINCPAKTNGQAFEQINVIFDKISNGLIFINLSDSDVLYGHRNDISGFRDCLIEIDAFLETLLPKLLPDDILMITADHGNDPFTPSTDHNREKVPLLIYGKRIVHNNYLGDMPSFTVVSDFIKNYFGIPADKTIFDSAMNTLSEVK